MESPSGAATTGGQASLARLFFSSSGRMGRGPFLAATAVLLALFAAYDALARGWGRTATIGPVFLVLFFSAACVLSKRLHDRGRAGWWAGLILLGFMFVWPWPEGAAETLFLAGLVWAAVDLGAMPGRPGLNRYGPP